MGKTVVTSGLPDIASPGILVTDDAGRVGVTTDWIKKSGPAKGRVIVQWAGVGYQLAEWPEDLKRKIL